MQNDGDVRVYGIVSGIAAAAMLGLLLLGHALPAIVVGVVVLFAQSLLLLRLASVRRQELQMAEVSLAALRESPLSLADIPPDFRSLGQEVAHLVAEVRAKGDEAIQEAAVQSEMLARLPYGLATLNQDLTFHSTNAAFRELLGISTRTTSQRMQDGVEAPELLRMARELVDEPVASSRQLELTLGMRELSVKAWRAERHVLLVVEDRSDNVRSLALAEAIERRWHDLLDSLDAIGWQASPDLRRVLWTNPRAAALLGQPADWLECVTAEDRPAMLEACKGLKVEGQTAVVRVRVIDGSGAVRSLVGVVQAVKPPGNLQVQLLGVFLDATRQKQSEEQLRDFFENSQGFLYTHLMDGTFIAVNPAAAHSLGYEPQDMIGKPLAEFVATSTRHRLSDYLQRLQEQGNARGIMRMVSRKGEKRVWLYQNALYSEGSQQVVRGQALDISERHHAEDQLRMRTQQLQTVTDAMTAYLESGDWPPALSILVRSALQQSLSDAGYCGVLVGEKKLRVLAFQGFELARGQAQMERQGFVESALPALLVEALGKGDPMLSADVQAVLPEDLRPTGELKSIVHIPVRVGSQVVGVLGVARTGVILTEDDRDRLAVLVRTAGILFDSYRRMEREEGLENQLRLAQKMEAVAQLAGGVAHDFNNILTIIMGYGGVVLERMDPSSPLREEVREMTLAAERAAALTRQLLTFSRRQVMTTHHVDLNAVLDGMEKMLKRLIGEDVDLSITRLPSLPLVLADPGHVEQVLMNLVVNARDAMPQGGKLTVETGVSEGDGVVVPPGQYVLLAVSDTGCGMDEETQARIFEPFFTTKEMGKGTGLGLSTVYGIVKQWNGVIVVDSEIGRGTTFKIHLPMAVVPALAAAVEARPAADVRGNETVLVVEDEAPVREFASQVLKRKGYEVLVAENGEAGLKLCREHAGEIHLLVTDVVMPVMSGPEMVAEVTRLRPDMRVLYTSGYTDDAMVHHGIAHCDIAFLEKPFTGDQLALKVREVLDATPAKA
ncbi:MAG: ATP-binding protein [Candidatus Xenobia bacterium]